MDIQQQLVESTLRALIGRDAREQMEVLREFAQRVVDVVQESTDEQNRVMYRAAALQGLLANPSCIASGVTDTDEHEAWCEDAKKIGDRMFEVCRGE